MKITIDSVEELSDLQREARSGSSNLYPVDLASAASG